MADRSAIEWTDATWNPTTGCDQVSPGCDNCYALTMAGRLKLMGSPGYQEDGDPRTSGPGFALQMHPDRLGQPLRWLKPRKVFVNSMSDLFHPKVEPAFIAAVFDVMRRTPQHTYQVLTKRPKRMKMLLRDGQLLRGDVLPNVWLGTSVEDQPRADERIPALLDTPAAVRFLSCEPLLGPVDLAGWLHDSDCPPPDARDVCICENRDLREVSIDWVIVGGESGPGARPMHPEWAYALQEQCSTAGVPFFFKQWGAHGPYPREIGDHTGITAVAYDGCHYPKPFNDDPAYHQWARDHDHTRPNRLHAMYRVGKKQAGRDLDGRTWDQFPEAVVPA